MNEFILIRDTVEHVKHVKRDDRVGESKRTNIMVNDAALNVSNADRCTTSKTTSPFDLIKKISIESLPALALIGTRFRSAAVFSAGSSLIGLYLTADTSCCQISTSFLELESEQMISPRRLFKALHNVIRRNVPPFSPGMAVECSGALASRFSRK